MATKNYDTISVRLESEDYELKIYKIPEDELDDLLSYFTRERGLIPKSLYEDFLMVTCVANINEFLQYLTVKSASDNKPPPLMVIRKEIVDRAIEHNPKLDPKNIIINKNKVVKVKVGRKKADDTFLSNNEWWDKELMPPSTATSHTTSDKKLDTSKIKHVKDLNYQRIQKYWRRITQYIIIKQFEPGSEMVILGDRRFADRIAFEQYVVAVCVDSVEELFSQIDRLRLPDRVPGNVLMNELYKMCINLNPFLSYELYGDSLHDEEDVVNPFDGPQMAAEASEDIMSSTLHTKAKLFRDVPKDDLLALGDNIKKRVVGQDSAIDNLVEAIQRASVGLKDPEHPIGSFIFTGYTGVGKTYSAKILAEELIGTRNGVIMIDCSEYSADHEYSKLIGAPSGYIGHEQGGYLTNAIKRNPFSVVLFDEIEKASDKVHQLLLQIMDDARLTDGRGKKVSFRDAIIIMTSNLGVKEVLAVSKTIGFGDVSKLTPDKQLLAVKEALKKKFKPEFLNRITAMINFGTLNKDHYMSIIQLELYKLKRNLQLNRTPYSKLMLEFDKSLYNYIYKVGIDEKFGARPLQRAIEKEISTPLARKILMEDIDCANSKVKISINRGKLQLEVECIKVDEEDVCEPPSYMTVGNGD